jgi:hypothetical protein
MKIKEGLMIRTVAGQNVVIPVSGDLNLNMMIRLNETGLFLWEQLQKETTVEELVEAVLKNYDIDEEDAKMHVENFLGKLKENEFLE